MILIRLEHLQEVYATTGSWSFSSFSGFSAISHPHVKHLCQFPVRREEEGAAVSHHITKIMLFGKEMHLLEVQ